MKAQRLRLKLPRWLPLLALPLLALVLGLFPTQDSKGAPGSGTLYATDASGGHLLTIDRATGAGAIVGDMGAFSPAQADQARLLTSSGPVLGTPSGVTLRLTGTQVVHHGPLGFTPQISAELTNGSTEALYVLGGLAPERPYLSTEIGGARQICAHHFLWWSWDCFTFCHLEPDENHLTPIECDDPSLRIAAGVPDGDPHDHEAAPADVMVAVIGSNDLQRIATALGMDPEVVRLTPPSLHPGESWPLVLRAPIQVVDPSLVPKPVTVGVTLADDQGSSDLQVFECSVLGDCTTTVLAPDLTCTKELKPGLPPARPGGTLAYIIKCRNIGARATPPGIDVQLRDLLPAGSSLVYWTANSGICANSPPNVDCSRGRMAPGEEWWVEIKIKVPWRVCSLVNKVTVDPFDRIKETDESNNTASLTTFVGVDRCATPTPVPATPTPVPATPTPPPPGSQFAPFLVERFPAGGEGPMAATVASAFIVTMGAAAGFLRLVSRGSLQGEPHEDEEAGV